MGSKFGRNKVMCIKRIQLRRIDRRIQLGCHNFLTNQWEWGNRECRWGRWAKWEDSIQCYNNRCNKIRIRCYMEEIKVKWIQCFNNKCSCISKCSSKCRWIQRSHNKKCHLNNGSEWNKKSNKRKLKNLNNSWIIIKCCKCRKKK